MGIFDFLSKNSSDVRYLKKQIQSVQDKRALSIDRMNNLKELREAISEAVSGLLRRFDFQYDKSIEDEQEKEWTYHTLVELGPGILPELRTYMKEASSLAWPLKVLGEVGSGGALLEIVKELCERNNNTYVRDPIKKIQLLGFMGEHQHPDFPALLLPYLEDMDEGVRVAAVEALLHQAHVETMVSPLMQLLASPTEESRRLKLRILEGLAKMGVSIPKEMISNISKVVQEVAGFQIDAQGKIKLTE